MLAGFLGVGAAVCYACSGDDSSNDENNSPSAGGAALSDAGTAKPDAGGSLVACHWRHPEPDLRLSASDVHATLQAGTGMTRAAHYEDEDFLLDVWTLDGRSVAHREGLA